MTAETLTATRADATFPVFKAVGSGVVCAAYGTYEIAANVEAGDIFKMCKVPKGATIIGGWFYGDDLDTGTGVLDRDLGWAANGGSGTYDAVSTDGLGNLGALPGAAFANGNISRTVGLVYPFSGVFADGDLPTFTEETTIQIYANVAANVFTAGAVSIVVLYVVS